MLNHIHLKYLDLLLLLTLTTYTNSTSYLNSFGRYCSLKNPAFWLVKRFLELNLRARFFPDTWFLQKVADHYYFHIQVKKVHLNGSDFLLKPRKPQFFTILGPPDPTRLFFQKSDVATSFNLWPSNFMQKIRETLMSSWTSKILSNECTDEQTAEFTGHVRLSVCPIKGERGTIYFATAVTLKYMCSYARTMSVLTCIFPGNQITYTFVCTYIYFSLWPYLCATLNLPVKTV